MKRINLWSVAGILIGVLGVAGPIAWDYYKSKSEVELKVLESSVIIQQRQVLEGLVITYAGEQLKELSKTTFSLLNTGRTPIRKNDVVKPLSMHFTKGSNVIDVKVESLQPQNLEVTAIFNKESGVATFEFPLLNPGDGFAFSVLAKAEKVDFEAEARIAGLSDLRLIREAVHPSANRKVPWTVYPVGFFSLLISSVCFAGIRPSIKELKTKRLLKKGELILPVQTKEEFIRWLNGAFDFTTLGERAPLLTLLSVLPEAEGFTSINKDLLEEQIHKLVKGATSNIAVLIFAVAIVGAGFIYVYSYVWATP